MEVDEEVSTKYYLCFFSPPLLCKASEYHKGFESLKNSSIEMMKNIVFALKKPLYPSSMFRMYSFRTMQCSLPFSSGKQPTVYCYKFCSSTSGSSPPPSPPASAAGVPSTAVTHPLQPVGKEQEEKISSEALAAQFRLLSKEDQELILSALHDPSSQKPSKMGGKGIGTQKGEMVATFTCGRCDYRMVKRFSKHAYTKGVVVVQCPNCEVKHLLADHLGWWNDHNVPNSAKTIEDILRERGEKFIHLGNGDYQALCETENADNNEKDSS